MEPTRATVGTGEAEAFPVRWDDPADADRTYFADPMHNPFPLSPRFQATSARWLEHGWTAAARECGIPDRGRLGRFQNDYLFDRVDCVEPASEDEAREARNAVEQALRAELPRLMERWQGEHLPR